MNRNNLLSARGDYIYTMLSLLGSSNGRFLRNGIFILTCSCQHKLNKHNHIPHYNNKNNQRSLYTKKYNLQSKHLN